MIFEYLPTSSLSADLEFLCHLCRVIPVTHILIPSNPLAKPYPDSLLVAMRLQDSFNSRATAKLQFIPTIKTSLYTYELLESVFLALEYAQIKQIAIITGDGIKGSNKGLNTYDALRLLSAMRKENLFLQELELFCALESCISFKNTFSFIQKLNFGVCNFITQPFYQSYNEDIKTIDSIIKNHVLARAIHSSLNKDMNTHSFALFKNFYYTLIRILNIQKKIRIFCGFFPLMNTMQVRHINEKKLGIFIPKDYSDNLLENPLRTNLELFYSLKEHDMSIGYARISDIMQFLEFLEQDILFHKK